MHVMCEVYYNMWWYVTAGVSGFEPDFLYPLENITVPQGRDATFTCVVNNLGGYRVSGDLATARVCIYTTILMHPCDRNLTADLYKAVRLRTAPHMHRALHPHGTTAPQHQHYNDSTLHSCSFTPESPHTPSLHLRCFHKQKIK